MSLHYDSDDAFPHSPGLTPVVPKATPSPSPPPIVTHRVIIRSSPHQNVSSPSSRRRKKSNRRKTQPTQGDWVLIREMDPNQPEIAEQVRERALNSESGSESDDEDMDERSQTAEPTPSGLDAQKAAQTAQNALSLVNPLPPITISSKNEMPPPSHRDSGVDVEHASKANLGVDTSSMRKPSIDGQPDSAYSSRNGDGPFSMLSATSPKSLPKRPEPTANGLHHKLPELQTHQSPATDGRAGSPEDKRLPPFSALSEMADSVLSEQESNRTNSFSHAHRQSVSSTGQSPTTMARQLSISSLSPNSAFPPLSASSPITGSSDVFLRTSHNTLFGGPRRPSQASENGPPYSASIHSTATNDSYQSSDGLSPSSQPTPIESRHRLSSLDALTNRTLPLPNNPNIQHIPPHGSGGFKCEHPGCTAAPFQTQYLLNSHANVHSQSRPHYCPVAGCARAEGGKGFKRKNEMIRHGLVHQSPGYVCPFCPDREHKYPRPDNLQRHVRVHHVDKDKDDPQLREVLAQRPEGGSRGRRRRTSS